MTQATFTEFRKHATAYFDSVEKGEVIRVMRHGKVIADVVPSQGSKNKKTWKRQGLPLVIPGVSLTKALLANRRESRA